MKRQRPQLLLLQPRAARVSAWLGALALPALLLIVAGLAACGKEEETPKPAATEPVKVVITPAPKPTGPLPAKAACITPACHATYLTAAHIHGPVSAQSCQSCHGADTGEHKYPLVRTGNATCTFCHAVAGTKAHQHKVIEQQGCLSCHSPHTSRAKYLLVADTVEALCAKCHLVPLKKHAHEPFAQGQCTVCHQAHESENTNLLRNGSGPEHCYGCHAEKKKAIAQQPHVHKVSAESCVACHGPHATDFPHQLKKSVNDTCLTCHDKVKAQIASASVAHGAMAAGCSACHDPHASAQPAELKARMDKLCLTCHDKPVKDKNGRVVPSMAGVLAAKYLHGPVKAGNCSDCHLPHGGNQPNLLKAYFPDTFYASFDVKNYALCFGCHDQKLVLEPKTENLTGFRDGGKNLHFVHVNRAEKGRTCKTCHEVHGSDLPKHLATNVPFEGSNWAMPIRYEAAADGGACTPGCHKERSYSRSKPAGTEPAERGKP